MYISKIVINMNEYRGMKNYIKIVVVVDLSKNTHKKQLSTFDMVKLKLNMEYYYYR